MSINKQLKKELRDAALAGVAEFLCTIRGANFCGSGAEVQVAGMPPGIFMVRCPNIQGSAVYFEVKITEKT